jgi:two-component system nitrate/nitrite response regulator NarL
MESATPLSFGAVPNSVRIAVGDRNLLLRDLLRFLCGRYGIQIVGQVSTAIDLVDVCLRHDVDVAVTDITLADDELEPHLEALMATGVRVLVLCDDRSPERLTALLAMGVSGYLFHDSTPEQVAEAALAVASGAVALDPVAATTILDQWRRLRSRPMSLYARARAVPTPREQEVLAAMADGLATKAIARRLGVSAKTVENHKTRLFDKLGVRTQAHAVSLAIGHGLLAPGPVAVVPRDDTPA